MLRYIIGKYNVKFKWKTIRGTRINILVNKGQLSVTGSGTIEAINGTTIIIKEFLTYIQEHYQVKVDGLYQMMESVI